MIDIFASARRVFLGVSLGILVAVPVGFLLGWYRPARTFADPMINFFRALPPIALIPLVIVYFGVDELAKLVILFYASFFSGVIVMYEGVSQITPLYIRVAQTLGANQAEIFAIHHSPHRPAHPHSVARSIGRGLGDAGRIRINRGAARARRHDPECLDLFPARRHLCRHHLHRPDRADHGFDPAQDHGPVAGLAGSGHRMNKRAQFDKVSLSFDTPKGRLNVVEDVSYDINDGDFIAVIGPSGCGKTTMNEHARRLPEADDRQGPFDGRPVAGPGPERGVIFQEYGVFPWLTVKQNIAFGLTLNANHVATTERDAICDHYLGLMGLSDSPIAIASTCPAACGSGVAIARALAGEAAIPADGRAVRGARCADPRQSCRTCCSRCLRPKARLSC